MNIRVNRPIRLVAGLEHAHDLLAKVDILLRHDEPLFLDADAWIRRWRAQDEGHEEIMARRWLAVDGRPRMRDGRIRAVGAVEP